MKKVTVMLLLAIAMAFQFCATKKAVAPIAKAKPPAAVTYMASIEGIITNNCSPCHIPTKGNKEPLNTYLAAKGKIDGIIDRINRDPSARGFMPQRHAKLPDSLINAFVKWKADGLLEK